MRFNAIRMSQNATEMAKPEFLTAGGLRRRGWTGALIRGFAGPADQLAVNPHHPGGAAMRLYRSERIAEIEGGEEFIEALAGADRRRCAAEKALETKARKAAVSAAQNIAPPVLPPAPRDDLVAGAVRWFNELETWRSGAGKWVSTSDPDGVLLPIVVEFVLDRLHGYRKKARPIGLLAAVASAAVDRKIIEAIAASYPWLRPECDRRLACKVSAVDEVKQFI